MLHVERLPTASKHWLSYDLTDLVDDLNREGGTELRVQLIRKGEALGTEQVIRMNSPFLLVFSETVESNNRQTESNAVDDDDDSEEVISARTTRAKRSIPPEYYAYASVSNGGGHRKSTDNYLHDQDYDRTNHMEALRSKGPRMLHGRRKVICDLRSCYDTRNLQKLRRKKPRHDPDDPMMGFGRETNRRDDSAETVLTVQKQSRKSDDLAVYLLDGNRKLEEKCKRHEMVVDFRDIGWQDWVIAPKQIDAHYCAGICPYPLESDANPSNHAILQSALRSVGVNPDIPQVCCAPESMDSLTLLYYDDNGNVYSTINLVN
ncbi:Transforming growth factor beta like domain containing protein [Aphelenchoides avenae]|nr:Transforming growth factor beta like domain containing protein [Aphelenchus avenae]